MKNKFLYILIFLALFFALDRVIGGFLQTPKKVLIQDKKYDPYWRWKEFYALPKDSLDLIFLGSSHCYRSFDPKVFDEGLGIATMNMGSSAQTPLTSYYVLQEVLKTQKPKYLVVELYWVTLEAKSEFDNANHNFENMRWGSNKLEFFTHAYRPEDVVPLILTSLHYKNNFENAVRHARGKNISWASGDHYNGRGYVANANATTTEKLLESNQFKNVSFDEKKLQTRHLRYLEKIIALCRTRGIRVVFVTSPLPPTSLGMIKNYSDAHDYFAAIARTHDIPYVDYNVPEYQMDFQDSNFKDDDHLNAGGVEKLDRDFAGRLLGMGIGKSGPGQSMKNSN